MRRLTTTLGLLGTLALTVSLSSCSTFDRNDTAAIVNGTELTTDQLDTLAEHSTDAATIRTTLETWIRVISVGGPAELTTPATLEAARNAIVEQLVAEHGDAAKAAYEKGLDGAPYLCLAAFPIADDITPSTVLGKLRSGTSFADAAKEYSTSEGLAASGGIVADQSTGQDCFDLATFTTNFSQELVDALNKAKATVGTAVVVDAGDGTNLVLLLRGFDELSTSDQLLVAQDAIGAALLDIYAAADVWVNSRIGAWQPANGAVVVAVKG